MDVRYRSSGLPGTEDRLPFSPLTLTAREEYEKFHAGSYEKLRVPFFFHWHFSLDGELYLQER